MANKKAKGPNANTRRMIKNAGIVTVNKILEEFKTGDKVSVVINKRYKPGEPARRFHGRTGDIVGRQGNCYIVSVRQGKSAKTVIAAPPHLKLLKVA